MKDILNEVIGDDGDDDSSDKKNDESKQNLAAAAASTQAENTPAKKDDSKKSDDKGSQAEVDKLGAKIEDLKSQLSDAKSSLSKAKGDAAAGVGDHTGISVATFSCESKEKAETLLEDLFKNQLVADAQIINSNYERMFMKYNKQQLSDNLVKVKMFTASYKVPELSKFVKEHNPNEHD